MYWILECYGPSDQERASIDRVPFLPGVQWILGARFQVPIPTPLEITIESGLMMPMFSRGILLWREDVVATLADASVDNFDSYDSILIDLLTGRRFHNYKAINILGLVAAADLAKSKYAAPSGSALIDTDFDSLVIDQTKARGLSLFRLAECVTAIVVHQRVRQRLEEKGIQYLNFVAPDKWIG